MAPLDTCLWSVPHLPQWSLHGPAQRQLSIAAAHGSASPKKMQWNTKSRAASKKAGVGAIKPTTSEGRCNSYDAITTAQAYSLFSRSPPFLFANKAEVFPLRESVPSPSLFYLR